MTKPALAADLAALEHAAESGAAVDLQGLAAAVEQLCADALAAPADDRSQAAADLAAVLAALDRLGGALRQQQELSAKAAHRRAADAYKS